MQTKKHKLKLRKGVIISLPIALLLATFAITIIINKNNLFENTSTAKSVANENKIESLEYEESTNPSILSQNDFIKNLTPTLKKRKLDYTIIFYADKFKLNTKKVLEIAHKLTNNYEDATYNQNYVIAPSNLAHQFGPYKNAEAGIIEFIREIYRYPEKYGSSLEEIRASEDIETKRLYKNNHILLESGLTFEQFLAKMCEMYDIDKSLALAIVYEESGRMTSNLFNYSNNIGGQRGYAGWLKYPTLEAGVIGFVVSLNNIGENYSIDLSTTDSVYALSSVYVNGHAGNPSDSWTGKVYNYINTINTNNVFA